MLTYGEFPGGWSPPLNWHELLFEEPVPLFDNSIVLTEVIQGHFGTIPPSGLSTFWEKWRVECDRTGSVLIFDEIVTGFGRTGNDFGFQTAGVRPDILILGKSLGQGIPITAVLWDNVKFPKMKYSMSTTNAGNPFCCEVALECIKTYIEEGMLRESKRVGDALFTQLECINAPTWPNGGYHAYAQGSMIYISCPSNEDAAALEDALLIDDDDDHIITRACGHVLKMLPIYTTSTAILSNAGKRIREEVECHAEDESAKQEAAAGD